MKIIKAQLITCSMLNVQYVLYSFYFFFLSFKTPSKDSFIYVQHGLRKLYGAAAVQGSDT